MVETPDITTKRLYEITATLIVGRIGDGDTKGCEKIYQNILGTNNRTTTLVYYYDLLGIEKSKSKTELKSSVFISERIIPLLFVLLRRRLYLLRVNLLQWQLSTSTVVKQMESRIDHHVALVE